MKRSLSVDLLKCLKMKNNYVLRICKKVVLLAGTNFVLKIGDFRYIYDAGPRYLFVLKLQQNWFFFSVIPEFASLSSSHIKGSSKSHVAFSLA